MGLWKELESFLMMGFLIGYFSKGRHNVFFLLAQGVKNCCCTSRGGREVLIIILCNWNINTLPSIILGGF